MSPLVTSCLQSKPASSQISIIPSTHCPPSSLTFAHLAASPLWPNPILPSLRLPDQPHTPTLSCTKYSVFE